jgi:isoleucyl-tRNA synthetase
MIMEEIYGGLTGGKSVHLEDWPDPQDLPSDNALVVNMDKLRDAASTGLRLREDAGLRVRLPLNTATVAGKGAEDLSEISSLLAEEINVRQIILTNEINEHASMILKPNGEMLGPRLGKSVQKVFQAAKQGTWSRTEAGVVTIADESLQLGEYELLLEPVDPGTTAALKTNDVVVILDVNVTPELHAEGAARDLIRSIQQARKDNDLNVTDRISVEIRWSPDNLLDIKTHAATISEAVLADSLKWLPGNDEPSVAVETTMRQ